MGVYLQIVAGAIKLFNAIAQRLQQHHDEMNGVTAQKEATNEAIIEELKTLATPVTTADRDKLWDQNKTKFGPNGSGASGAGS